MTEDARLSAAGMARKREMFIQLCRLVDRRRRRRALLRAGASCAALLLIAACAIHLLDRGECPPSTPREAAATQYRGDPSNEHSNSGASATIANPAPVYQHIDFAILDSDPSAFNRCAVTDPPVSSDVFVDDDEAMALLADAGVALSLVRCGNETFFLSNTPR